MTLNEFHAMLGETIMFCQTIEHDIKWIYAGIKPGNIYENFQSIASWTLGGTLKQLEELGGPSFSRNDYR